MLGWDRHLESWIAGHRVSALDPVFRWLTYIGTWGAVWLLIAVVIAAPSRRWQVLLWVAVADVAAQLSTSLAKARARWLIRCFSAGSISPNVRVPPSGTNIGS